MKLFLNTDMKLSEQRKTKHVLHINLKEERENKVILISSTLCFYFEKEILQAGKEMFPLKDIEIYYDQEVELDFFSFKFFKELILD